MAKLLEVRAWTVLFGLAAAIVLPPRGALAETRPRTPLIRWSLQSSALAKTTGAAASLPGFDAHEWHAIAVPGTVVGALVEAGVYKDPYFGMNLRGIPGTTYPIGERFTLLPTPAESPFKPAWWYRTEFDGAAAGRHVALHFDGINYRANIWLNGRRIARASDVAGAFRRYEFDVTDLIRAGARNALAVEVFGPEPDDLAIMWVDWNPTPADKNMGLWGDVYLTESGPITLRRPHVITDLELPSLASARLAVSAEVANRSASRVGAVVRGAIGEITFSRAVELAPRESKTVRFTPDDVPALAIDRPRVWWPYRYGDQPLYALSMAVEADGVRSDQVDVTFGIQKVESSLTPEGHRLFAINGKPILIRGGGWASDMLLRPKSPERLRAELAYVREMGLNTIRLEGKLETDEFYDVADRMGILLMPGWCCCDQWEMWKKWDAEDYRVAPASLESQLQRLRNHPSVLVWLNGSDFPPPADVERTYLDVARSCEWRKPLLSNATDAPGPVSGPTGVKMRGPYDYVPPSYWLLDRKNGGAFGFATEVGPGAAVPPVESLRRMLPPGQLWPINDVWRFHAGGDEFKDLSLFTGALEGRYGRATSVEDYSRKAQALAYEGQRAMFEAYGRNKYVSTGVIQWMLNNAWPSMIWHLYDYYLRPGGGYFGSKKANEPLHVQYSYDDRSIAVVNDTLQAAPGLAVQAAMYDLNLEELFSREASVDAAPDSVSRPFALPVPEGVSGPYFVRLILRDRDARIVSRNFYWLSAADDEIDWANTKWYYTPTKTHADLRALASLPGTTLSVSAVPQPSNDGTSARVTVRNTGRSLAFQVRMKFVDPTTGDEILPVLWEDNYFELFPGESRELSVSVPGTAGRAPVVTAEAWNAPLAR